jgi:hypothetical protein
MRARLERDVSVTGDVLSSALFHHRSGQEAPHKSLKRTVYDGIQRLTAHHASE